MSEFHRMITYLYLYEQGTKSRNVGFAKIERRDQRCLLEIHMKNTGCSLSPVQVYFYVQKEELLAGISLGNFSLTRGSGDFKTVLETKNFKESGYNIDDVKGIYIPLTAQMILVSQWDDDEFRRENFIDLSDTKTEHAAVSENTPGKNNVAEDSPAKNISAKNTPVKNISDKNAPTENLARESLSKQNPAGENLSRQNPAGENLSKQNPAGENLSRQNPAGKNLSKQNSARNSSLKDFPTREHLPAKNMTPKDSLDGKITPLPENITTNNRNLDNPDVQDTSSISQQDEEQSPTKPTDALKAVEALPRPTEEAVGFRAMPGKKAPSASQSHRHSQTYQAPPYHAQSAENSQTPGHSQADAPEDWDLRWRFILENYPVMTPFAGDEHTRCVRMELKDLRQLPKQFWYLGNNSFLLHGFFNYRYFILGMTEEFGVRKWFVGVPGVFQNPERVMAALFGFPEFRSEKPSPINTGEFGYWYRYLNELSEPAKK